MVPAVRRTGHPFAASSFCELAQKIEFVFTASLETIRRGPSRKFLSFVQSGTSQTWQPARRVFLLFFSASAAARLRFSFSLAA
jgi:hypothetical protein